jgi:hypothetical protein
VGALETTLRVWRRAHYGNMKVAAKALGLSRWTLHRAECALAVGAETKRCLEEAFGFPWETLMSDWVDGIRKKRS